MKRLPYLTLLSGLFAIILHSFPEGTALLQFDRAAFVRGELWRLVTGHFTHYCVDHLCWDVIAFLAFGSLVEIRSRRAWLVCLSVCAIVISLGVAWLQPQFTFYRGLSGLDSALFAFVATDLLSTGWRENDRPSRCLGVFALIGFVGKTLFELTTGLTLFVATDVNFQAVPLAHLLGAACGALVGFQASKTAQPDNSLRVSPSTGQPGSAR